MDLKAIPSPALYFASGILQRHKPVLVQAFIPEAADEEFDMLIEICTNDLAKCSAKLLGYLYRDRNHNLLWEAASSDFKWISYFMVCIIF